MTTFSTLWLSPEVTASASACAPAGLSRNFDAERSRSLSITATGCRPNPPGPRVPSIYRRISIGRAVDLDFEGSLKPKSKSFLLRKLSTSLSFSPSPKSPASLKMPQQPNSLRNTSRLWPAGSSRFAGPELSVTDAVPTFVPARLRAAFFASSAPAARSIFASFSFRTRSSTWPVSALRGLGFVICQSARTVLTELERRPFRRYRNGGYFVLIER